MPMPSPRVRSLQECNRILELALIRARDRAIQALFAPNPFYEWLMHPYTRYRRMGAGL